jgi:predicted transcriptional regulator with HTH domain
MLEDKVRDAIVSELQRQSDSDPSKLRIEVNQDRATANGEIDLIALATAVVGAVAGAP